MDDSSGLIGILTIAFVYSGMALFTLYWAGRSLVAVVNRGIDRDAGRDMPEHVRHRYLTEPGAADMDELYANWVDRRDRDHDEALPEVYAPDSPAAHLDHRHSPVVAPRALGAGRDRRGRRYPVVTVTRGFFAGRRGEVVGPVRKVAGGEWFVRFADGSVTVLDGDWFAGE